MSDSNMIEYQTLMDELRGFRPDLSETLILNKVQEIAYNNLKGATNSGVSKVENAQGALQRCVYLAQMGMGMPWE